MRIKILSFCVSDGLRYHAYKFFLTYVPSFRWFCGNCNGFLNFRRKNVNI